MMIVRLLPLILTTFRALGSLAEQQPSASVANTTIVEAWPPAFAGTPSVQDLHREYQNIFKHGNRNAASHRWSTFLLERSTQMTATRLRMFFTGFCAVSGSPVRPSNYNRYRLRLPKIGGGSNSGNHPSLVTGYMHYCCWPCVCDTQDFIRIDTLNVTTTTTTSMGDNNNGNSNNATASLLSESQTTTTKMYFAVIGNPCDHPELLETPFHQPFGRGTTTLKQTAQEVRCLEDGTMEGATLSDHGYVIISMFFDANEEEEVGVQELRLGEDSKSNPNSNSMIQNLPPQPGRISTDTKSDGTTTTTIMFQDEHEFGAKCEDRAANGYNSGMGEIFRKVCAISPISSQALLFGHQSQPKLVSERGGEGTSCDAVL